MNFTRFDSQIEVEALDQQKQMGVSENSVPHCTQWLMIIIPFLNGYFIGKINPTFSAKTDVNSAQEVHPKSSARARSKEIDRLREDPWARCR